MDVTRSDQISEQMKASLAQMKVADWMRTPPVSAPADITLQELSSQFALEVDPSMVVVSSDQEVLGMIHLNDIRAQPPERWSEIRVSSVMRPLTANAIVSPDDTMALAVEHLFLLPKSQSVLPVAEHGYLVGELRRDDVLSRLEHFEAPQKAPSRVVHLSFDSPVYGRDGYRRGRLTRLAVDARPFQVTHAAVRMDGFRGREITVPDAHLEAWTEDGMQTDLDDAGFESMPDFVSYDDSPTSPEITLDFNAERRLEPPLRLVGHHSIPETSVALDRAVRLWSGTRSLGRLHDFEIDPDARRLVALGYESGLIFHSHHRVPADRIKSLAEERIDIDPLEEQSGER